MCFLQDVGIPNFLSVLLLGQNSYWQHMLLANVFFYL